MTASSSRERATWVRAYRLFFGVLALAGVVRQLLDVPNIANFFSFFTIQSNIIGGVVLIAGALIVMPASTKWDLIRGGSAIYLILTGVIYNTLLLDVDVQISHAWINNVHHRIMPLVMLLDLLIVPMTHRLRMRQAWVWAVYPLAYFAYALIRGVKVDWYPYPFLDPREDGGYLQVAIFSVVVLVGFLGFSWIVTEVNARRLRSIENASVS